MYQRVELIGRLGRDPEERYTQAGQPVCSFSVATDRRWVDAGGEKQKQTTWWRCSAWGKLAEICNAYLEKGSLVFLVGELSEPKPYQRREGTWAASLEMTVREMKMLSKAENEGEAEAHDDDTIPF